MWINLIEDPMGSQKFTACGPFESFEEADANGPIGGVGYWVCRIVNPVEDNGYSATGGVIVFDGNITRENWVFIGPFVDIEVARKWAKANGAGAPLELEPVPEPA